MAKTTFTFLSGDNKTQIHCVSLSPQTDEIRGILQITHGMVEYIERYEDFAGFMNSHGFLVVGHDHLGHGESVAGPEDWGYFAPENGSDILVEDMHTLRTMTQEKYPGIPYVMLGHSMGSFLLRKYLSIHGTGLAGAILMGTGVKPDRILQLGKGLCRVIAAKKGWKYRSNLVQNMAFSGNNHKFSGENQANSWLTRDGDIVKSYSASPKCTFIFTLNGFYTLFDTILFINRQENIDKLPKDLPILLVSGKDDPVGGFGKGVRTVYGVYKKAGISDISCRLYPDDRHEILNELDREQVYRDIIGWIKKKVQI